jgi:hypothetical protein
MNRLATELATAEGRLLGVTEALKNLTAACHSNSLHVARCAEALESLAEDLDEGGCDPRAVAKKIRAQASARSLGGA